MMKKKQKLIIPFVGLKEGNHQFEFEIDSSFFEQFDYSIIQEADFIVKVDFEKKVNLFNLKFRLKGNIVSECDRCTDPITLKVKGEESLIVKFGENTFEGTDEIKIISSGEHELDLTSEIYEYIHMLLPNKVQHERVEDCNQEIIEKLNKLTNKQEKKEIDPRWAALSNLKDNSE